MTAHERDWLRQRPALFSYGFRPFFLGASLWAVLAMVLWLLMLSGRMAMPVVFDPVSWHAQAFVFGYLSAVIAGFLLTALPNWTGRPAMTGLPLAGLFMLWVLGRGASLVSAHLPPLVFGVADCAMPVVLAGILLREIVMGRNWRNLIVFAMLVVLILGNVLFHMAAQSYAAGNVGLRIALAAAVMLVAVIGGRIVPAFTRNWLKASGASVLPPAPMTPFDKVALLALLGTLGAWVARPEAPLVSMALMGVGVLHLARLARWKGRFAWREPAVWVLHVGYLCIPLGAILMGVSRLPGAQHLWMAGAIGIMTLAVMTRASLGHTGRAVQAGAGTTVIYAAIIGAVILRPVADVAGAWADGMLMLSGGLWITAFGGFAVVYGPMLVFSHKAG